MSRAHAGAKNGFYGKKHSSESLEMMSVSKKGKLAGKNNPNYGNCKKVICLTTGEIFRGISAAANYYGHHRRLISGCCKGDFKSGGKHPITHEKLHWAFYESGVI